MLCVNSFEDLHRILRGFRNFGDPQAAYDFGGVTHLMLALLDNLREHALPSELEAIGERFEPEQIQFFKQIAARLDSQLRQ